MEMSSSNQSAAHPNQEPDICDPKPEKWDRFAEWIHCFCVVTFDLELGQVSVKKLKKKPSRSHIFDVMAHVAGNGDNLSAPR
jgi:hypothetical protein